MMPSAATWMGLQMITLSKVSQTKKDKYMISLQWGAGKNNINELIYKTEIDSQTQNTNLWLPNGKGAGRDKLVGVGMNIYTPLYIK